MYTQNLLQLFMKIFSIAVHKILYFKDINISSNTSKWQCIAGFEIVLYCNSGKYIRCSYFHSLTQRDAGRINPKMQIAIIVYELNQDELDCT